MSIDGCFFTPETDICEILINMQQKIVVFLCLLFNEVRFVVVIWCFSHRLLVVGIDLPVFDNWFLNWFLIIDLVLVFDRIFLLNYLIFLFFDYSIFLFDRSMNRFCSSFLGYCCVNFKS